MKKIDEWLLRNQLFALFIVVLATSFGFIFGYWAATSWIDVWGNPIEHIINFVNN